MDRAEILTILFLISVSLSYGLNHNRKKYRTLEDFNDLPDLTHVKENEFTSSINTKRMAMDDNTRSRESWGQMSQMSQYYPNPSPYPNNNNYYRSMSMPSTNSNSNGYYSTTVPSTSHEPMYREQQSSYEQEPTAMSPKPKQQLMRGKLPKPNGGGVEHYDYERVGMMSNKDKKVKILICRLQSEHQH